MSELLTNTITIRGQAFLVKELDGKTMAESRRVLAEDKARLEAYVAWKCTVDPKFASEADVLALPQIFADKLSAEAFRLTNSDDSTPKNA
jgi:hypothetical protein